MTGGDSNAEKLNFSHRSKYQRLCKTRQNYDFELLSLGGTWLPQTDLANQRIC